MANFRQIDENPLLSMCDDLQSLDAFDYFSDYDEVTIKSSRLKFYDSKPIYNEDEVQGYNTFPNVSDISFNTSNTLKSIKERFLESVNQGKKVFRGNAVYYLDKMKKCIAIKDEILHDEDITEIIFKNEKYLINVSTENADQIRNNCTEVVKVISRDEKKYANKNINDGIKGNKSGKSGKQAKLNQFPLPEAELMRDSLNFHRMRKKPIIETLADSLKYFNLSSCLQQLENSLEDVRRNKKTKEDHEIYYKRIDKEIQKLSFKYHPDRVRNKGCTEEQILIAQTLQTAINATRTALKLLNSAFVEDIGTDHKFGFYTHFSIHSLSNEDEVKQHIFEIILEIGVISRIKQENIISEIRKFLIESGNCIASFLNGRVEFEKHRDSALFHLKCCIQGFETLSLKLGKVKEQYKVNKNCQNMYLVIQNMENEAKSNSKLLKLLNKVAETSLKGKYNFFKSENMDSYYVLPLVCYTNVILMCDIMKGLPMKSSLNHHDREQLANMMRSYCNSKKPHIGIALTIINKIQRCSRLLENKKETGHEFYIYVEEISKFMEFLFKVENYNVAIMTDLHAVDLEKCMTMMREFQEKQKELAKDIKEFKNENKKMHERCEKFVEMLETTEELNQKIKERLDKNKLLSEQVFSALSYKR